MRNSEHTDIRPAMGEHGPLAPLVTLVIPGRNCELTIGPCLSAACAILDDPASRLADIVFVDDASDDNSAGVAAEFPVRVVANASRGAGAARNTGLRVARTPLVWFIDSDCVPQPNALRRLLPHLDEPDVAGAAGSYGIMNPNSLLATIIHEEIVQRHIRLATTERVDAVDTFNVLYRRDIILALGGFDERCLDGQDAECSRRATDAGHRIRFEIDSRVDHFHDERLADYLATQHHQARRRAASIAATPSRLRGDSATTTLDHANTPLALAALASTPLLAAPALDHTVTTSLALLSAVLWGLLLLIQFPITAAILHRTRDPRTLAFAPLGALRAAARCLGLVHGFADHVRAADPLRPSDRPRRVSHPSAQ